MKIILSWDVGIKNLAYCKIKFEDDNFEILKWNTINLGEEEQTCSHTELNKKCLKKAKEYKITGEQVNKYYCEKHVKKVAENGKYKLIKKNCNKISLNDLALKLHEELDNNRDIYNDVDQILIENQPTLKNPRMYGLSILLMSYFLLRGKQNISMIAPFRKLSINKEKTATELAKATSKNQIYSLTKKLGKKYCLALISENDKNLLIPKKQDDLCDAFLQGFRYIFKTIPQKYIEKLNAVN